MARICIYLTSFGDGGVERMLVNLARGLSALGTDVDFIVKHTRVPYLDRLPPEVRLIEFGAGKQAGSVKKLLHYLEQNRPDALISAKRKTDIAAMKAKAKTTAPTRFFLRPGSSISGRLHARNANPLRRWITIRRLRWIYEKADGITAVSQCVAEDVIQTTGIDPARVRVVRNPNITPELYELAAAPLDHAWFEAGQPPVLLGIGGLRKAKDFPTLLRAFALVAKQRPCRLMILGKGHLHDSLVDLARELGIQDQVAMPGFVHNPYAYLSRAAMFVLSSLWEGSPNVLTEALALGIPIVSTDCRCGPREITQNGKFGSLVPVADAEALSRAIRETLDNPPNGEWLKTATREYTMEKSAAAYLEAMGLSKAAETEVAVAPAEFTASD